MPFVSFGRAINTCETNAIANVRNTTRDEHNGVPGSGRCDRQWGGNERYLRATDDCEYGIVSRSGVGIEVHAVVDSYEDRQ